MPKQSRARELRAVYVISVAANLAGMHPQTLRIYERPRLIEPFRTPGGTRRYSDEDLARLALIQELTEQGINLEGAKRIMLLEAENQKLRMAVGRLRKKVSIATRSPPRQSARFTDLPEPTSSSAATSWTPQATCWSRSRSLPNPKVGSHWQPPGCSEFGVAPTARS